MTKVKQVQVMKRKLSANVTVACVSYVKALRRLRATEVAAERAIRAAEKELQFIGERVASGEFKMRDVQRALVEAQRSDAVADA